MPLVRPRPGDILYVLFGDKFSLWFALEGLLWRAKAGAMYWAWEEVLDYGEEL